MQKTKKYTRITDSYKLAINFTFYNYHIHVLKHSDMMKSKNFNVYQINIFEIN